METVLSILRKRTSRCNAPAGETGNAPAASSAGQQPASPAPLAAAPQPDGGRDPHSEAPTGPPAGVVTLPERLDSRAAGPLAKDLLPCSKRSMVIDASAVRFVGARCAETLLSARLACAAIGETLTFLDASDDFTAGLELLGLTDLVTDPHQATTSEVTP